MVNTKNIFSRLNAAVEKSKRNLKEAQARGSVSEERFYKKQLRALSMIEEYRDGLAWIKKQDMKEKSKFCIKCNFDYVMIQEHYSIGYDTAKSIVHRISNTFEKKIGEDTLDLIMSSDDMVGAGLTSFYMNSGKISLSDLFLSSIIDSLPEADCANVYEMAECKDEIEFLYMYSMKGFQEFLSRIDLDKLANVIYVIAKNTEKYKQERSTLVNLYRVATKITLDDVTKELGFEDEDDPDSYVE